MGSHYLFFIKEIVLPKMPKPFLTFCLLWRHKKYIYFEEKDSYTSIIWEKRYLYFHYMVQKREKQATPARHLLKCLLLCSIEESHAVLKLVSKWQNFPIINYILNEIVFLIFFFSLNMDGRAACLTSTSFMKCVLFKMWRDAFGDH